MKMADHHENITNKVLTDMELEEANPLVLHRHQKADELANNPNFISSMMNKPKPISDPPSVAQSIDEMRESPSNSAIWSGVDSRIMLFTTQVSFSLAALCFGMYLIIEHDNNEGYMSFGSSLVMFVLGFLTKNPVMKKKRIR
jgi:ABC-type protease/lipase transport system fused ATPase/permease subunit